MWGLQPNELGGIAPNRNNLKSLYNGKSVSRRHTRHLSAEASACLHVKRCACGHRHSSNCAKYIVALRRFTSVFARIRAEFAAALCRNSGPCSGVLYQVC